MGLSEALVMQQVHVRNNPRRIDSILNRTCGDEKKLNNIATTPTEVKSLSLKSFRAEQEIYLKSNDLNADSKRHSTSDTKKNVPCKAKNRPQSVSMTENTVQANKSLSYSKDDEHEFLQNKNLNDDKQNKGDGKSLSNDEGKLCNTVHEELKEESKSDGNEHDRFTDKEASNIETSHYAIQNAEKEKVNTCIKKEAKMPDKVTTKEKERAVKAEEKEGKGNAEQDSGVNLLEKQMAEMQLNAKPELTKENIIKHARTLRKLLLKIKIKESTNAEASKSNLESLQEGEMELVERSPVQQSFVNAPLQSGSIVTQDTSQSQHPLALLNTSYDSLDWSMLSEMETDVLNLYSNHPELFDDVLDCFAQDTASFNEASGTDTNVIHTVLPEPVAHLYNELSNSPQASFMSSPRSEFSSINSPNAYSEQLQYVPSTPYALSTASSVTSPQSFFLPESPQSTQNHDLEKFSSENVMYIQNIPNTPEFNDVSLGFPDSRNTNMICNMNMNVLANVDTFGNTATVKEVTSVTTNSPHMSGNYGPEFSDMDSLSAWLNVKPNNSVPTSTNTDCPQQQVLYVKITKTADPFPQSVGGFNINSNNSSAGAPQSLDSIRRAPSIPTTICTSAKSRLEAMLDEKVKVNAIINIWSFSDQQISEGDENGDTHLMILVSKPVSGQYELVHALVERLKSMPGDPLAAVNENGESALLISSVLLPNHPLIARYIAETLLEKGSCLDQVDNCGKSPIHYLAEHGQTHLEVLREVMSLRDANNQPCFDVNRRCEEGTPLHIAIKSHYIRQAYNNEIVDSGSTVLFLISQGANTYAKDSHGQTVLHLAIRGACDLCLLQILLRVSPELVNVKDSNGDTPLHCAAMRNDIPLQRQANVVRLLVNSGACRNIIGSNGRVPLALVAPERKHPTYLPVLEDELETVTGFIFKLPQLLPLSINNLDDFRNTKISEESSIDK